MLGAWLGLAAALTFGLGDVLAGLLARRIGTLLSALITLVVSAAILIVAGIALDWRPPADAGWFGIVIAVGVFRALGFLALIESFRIGPLSVVSSISAASGAATSI